MNTRINLPLIALLAVVGVAVMNDIIVEQTNEIEAKYGDGDTPQEHAVNAAIFHMQPLAVHIREWYEGEVKTEIENEIGHQTESFEEFVHTLATMAMIAPLMQLALEPPAFGNYGDDELDLGWDDEITG